MSELSEREREIVARFEAAPYPPEVLRAQVANAVHAATCRCGTADVSSIRYWQLIADAAILAMRGAS